MADILVVVILALTLAVLGAYMVLLGKMGGAQAVLAGPVSPSTAVLSVFSSSMSNTANRQWDILVYSKLL
jgi:hypothetical protein